MRDSSRGRVAPATSSDPSSRRDCGPPAPRLQQRADAPRVRSRASRRRSTLSAKRRRPRPRAAPPSHMGGLVRKRAKASTRPFDRARPEDVLEADEESARPVDVWRVLESSINLASERDLPRARLTTERGPVPPVLASEARLGQVFVNLSSTRRRRSGRRGRPQRDLRGHAHDEPGTPWWRSATRRRHPTQLLARLFDPFFPRSPSARDGARAVDLPRRRQRAGGELSVESAPGRGARFA